MTTATEAGKPAKILLTISDVVWHSLRVAAAESERYARERAEREVRDAAEARDWFKKKLAEVLDIDGSDLTEPVLRFNHEGVPFLIFWASRDYSLAIVQLCSGCNQNWAGRFVDSIVRSHSELGHYLSSHNELLLCDECGASLRPAPAEQPAPRRPTLAERLHDLVREIALDAAMEAREL